MRVIDESGEDCLYPEDYFVYPEDYFVPIQLPRAAARAFAPAT